MTCGANVMEAVGSCLQEQLSKSGCTNMVTPSTKMGKICNGGPLSEGREGDLLTCIYTKLGKDGNYPAELRQELRTLSVVQLVSRVTKDVCK